MSWRPTRGLILMVVLLHLLIVASSFGYLWLQVQASSTAIHVGDDDRHREFIFFFIDKVDPIQGLALVWGIACVLVLTLAIPASVHGAFSRARAQHYLDQVILSGVSPYRFWLGKWIGSVIVLALLVGSTAPYVALFLTAGASWSWTLMALGLLGAYATQLALVTLALMLYMSEGKAFFMVITSTIGSTLFLMWFHSPMLVPFQLSPMNVFTGPWIPSARPYAMWQLIMVTLSSMAWISLVSAVALWLGPLSLLTRELASYDQAVFPGDRQRSWWFRGRKGLRLQAGLCFLYENRPDALRRADFRRRWLWREFTFLSLMLVGWLSCVELSVADRYHSDFYRFHVWVGLGGGFVNALLFTETRVAERCRLGRWEAWKWNRCCFMANSVILFVLAADLFWPEDLPGWKSNLQSQVNLVAVVFGFRSLLQALGMRFPSKANVVILGLLFCGGLVWSLFLLASLVSMLTNELEIKYEHAPWYSLALLSLLVGLISISFAHRGRQQLPIRVLI